MNGTLALSVIKTQFALKLFGVVELPTELATRPEEVTAG